MIFHDAYARPTPFELVFPDPADGAALMTAAREEAERLGVDAANPQSFVMLGSVATYLQRVQAPDAPATAVHQYGALLFHAAHHAGAGLRTYLVESHVARYLVDGAPPGDGVELPGDAGYVQLPRNLFWVRPHPDAPAEPVDGYHWTLGSGGYLHCLLALGMRGDRPGLVVVPVPEAPWAEAETWLHAQVREDSRDFETTLPGGELEGLLSLETAGEVLKLTSRLFRYLQVHAAAVVAEEPRTHGPEELPHSGLSYSRVTLDDAPTRESL